MFFATPDFGAGAMAMLVLLGVGLAVFGVALLCVVRGIVLLRRAAPGSKWSGLGLVAVGVLLPVCCCSGPSVLFRVHHDTPPLTGYPSGVVQEGMSAEEVRALLGNPHQFNDRNPERVTWLYYLDAIELNWFMVVFGPDGKVSHTGGS
jgi:hypothetical protein